MGGEVVFGWLLACLLGGFFWFFGWLVVLFSFMAGPL